VSGEFKEKAGLLGSGPVPAGPNSRMRRKKTAHEKKNYDSEDRGKASGSVITPGLKPKWRFWSKHYLHQAVTNADILSDIFINSEGEPPWATRVHSTVTGPLNVTDAPPDNITKRRSTAHMEGTVISTCPSLTGGHFPLVRSASDGGCLWYDSGDGHGSDGRSGPWR
jgi:hypothetical protein